MLLGLVRSGALPLARLVDALTRAPARIVGLTAPTLREGAVAEVVLVDPEAGFTVDPARLRSKSRNTPFLGAALKGRVKMTIADGRVVFEDGGQSGR